MLARARNLPGRRPPEADNSGIAEENGGPIRCGLVWTRTQIDAIANICARREEELHFLWGA